MTMFLLFLCRPHGTQCMTWLLLADTQTIEFSLEIAEPSTYLTPTQENLCFSCKIRMLQGLNLYVCSEKHLSPETRSSILKHWKICPQINKFNPMGDVIGSGMGEFSKSSTIIDSSVDGWWGELKAALLALAGVTVLVWDRNESLMNDWHKQEEAPTSAERLRSQRRSQQRSSRMRRGPATDGKLKKKLASLEEQGTKTKTVTGCSKQKLAQMRKK